jgi:UDP-N-acetylmuramyl pentapeptide phosphotransferase/UDP-N-acetylglucosamine-1-phosphate transferase
VPIPTMGGIAIFLSMLIIVISRPSLFSVDIALVLFSASILFATGLIDDLKDLRPRIKLYIQIIVAIIPVIHGIRIDNLNELGIGDIALPISFLISIICIVFFINAFNLIDGIDGLAGGMAIIALTSFSLLFYFAGAYDFCLLSAALAGSCLGFLVFNFNPARIFMGDTGSLFIGFLLAIFALRALQLPSAIYVDAFRIDSFSIVFALVLLPSLDAVRVFASRIGKGFSPFHPDKTHIHHLLLDAGMNHRTATLTLYTTQILILSLAFFPPPLIAMEIILGIFLIVFCFYKLIAKLSRILKVKRNLKNIQNT